MRSFYEKVVTSSMTPRKERRKKSIKVTVHLSPELASVIQTINDAQLADDPARRNVSIGHTIRHLIGLGVHRHGEQRRAKK